MAAGGVAGVWSAAPAWRNGRLFDGGRRVLAAVANGVLDGTLSPVAADRAAALQAHLERMDVTLAALAPHARAEFGDLLAVLATSPGRRVVAGLAEPWSGAPAEAIQAMLQGLRSSRWLLRRQIYHALRDLTHAAYYADEQTWRLLGYPGPRALH